MENPKTVRILNALASKNFDNPSTSDIATVYQNAIDSAAIEYERVEVYETRRGLGFRVQVPIRQWAKAHIEGMMQEAEKAASGQASAPTLPMGLTVDEEAALWREFQAFQEFKRTRNK